MRETEQKEPRDLRPRHEVRDEDKVARLAQSMREDGWKGRPVLCWDEKALTGTHRIAAAERAGIMVQCLVIDGDDGWALADKTDIYGRLGCDDEDVLIAMEEALGKDHPATRLMAREMVENGVEKSYVESRGIAIA